MVYQWCYNKAVCKELILFVCLCRRDRCVEPGVWRHSSPADHGWHHHRARRVPAVWTAGRSDGETHCSVRPRRPRWHGCITAPQTPLASVSLVIFSPHCGGSCTFNYTHKRRHRGVNKVHARSIQFNTYKVKWNNTMWHKIVQPRDACKHTHTHANRHIFSFSLCVQLMSHHLMSFVYIVVKTSFICSFFPLVSSPLSGSTPLYNRKYFREMANGGQPLRTFRVFQNKSLRFNTGWTDVLWGWIS